MTTTPEMSIRTVANIQSTTFNLAMKVRER